MATAPTASANSGWASAASSSRPSHVGDQLVGLVGLPERPADDAGLLVPGDAPVGVVVGLGHGGGDLGERLVLAVGQAGVDAEDQVGAQRRHLLEVDALGVADAAWGARRRPPQLVGGPGADGPVDAFEPLVGADRHGAERQHGVLVGEADGHDPLGRGVDRRRAVLVLDLDREALAAGASPASGVAVPLGGRARCPATAGGDGDGEDQRHEDGDGAAAGVGGRGGHRGSRLVGRVVGHRAEAVATEAGGRRMSDVRVTL